MSHGRLRRKNIFLCIFKIILRIILLPFVFVWILTNLLKKKRQRIKDKELIELYNMSQVDSLSGLEFEALVKRIFEAQGYTVQLTKASHDYGADLIVYDKSGISVVQTKCYSHTVGIKAVQEIIASQKHYETTSAFVVTNQEFSKDAAILASEYGVKLIDRKVLSGLIQHFKPKIEILSKKYVATLPEAISQIEAKYRFWI